MSGSFLTAYLTGTGALDNPVATGALAPAAALSRPIAAISATIGGVSAKLLFAGLTPGLTGVAQASVQIPNLAPGDHALIVRVAGALSRTGLRHFRSNRCT